jgi:hypothetical protein
MYYGIDASVKYSFMSLINSKVIDLHYMLGGSTFLGDSRRNIKTWCRIYFGFHDQLLRPWKTFGDREDANGTPDSITSNILLVLLSNLRKRYWRWWSYDKDNVRRCCWFKRTPMVVPYWRTKIVLMLVQTHLVLAAQRLSRHWRDGSW